MDTHTFIWWDSDPARLSPPVHAFLEDRSNIILLSVVSAWEIVIKQALGKFELSRPLDASITEQEANGVQVLPVSLEDVLSVADLPAIHGDPFDRLLIAQARREGAVLLTADPVIARYPVQILW